MTAPYTPTPLAVPIINPGVGGTGASPIPYISNSEYTFAPTAIDAAHLIPGGDATANTQALADTIRRASRWVDSMCFGSDPAGKGVSLAASLSVESVKTRVKTGELRLICDYRPIQQVVGIDVGFDRSTASSIGPAIAAATRIGRRTIYVPIAGPYALGRSGDAPTQLPRGGRPGGALYAVWSYVNGYPHTQLAADVEEGATTCSVNSTDGAGGLWGVFPSSGSFLGTELNVIDGQATERVFVQDAALNGATTTLTTSPFANAHTLPTAPDFIPVTAIPEDVHQAAIFVTTFLIKTRGVRGVTMPTIPGGRAGGQATGQAGAKSDYESALKLLSRGGYVIRSKQKT